MPQYPPVKKERRNRISDKMRAINDKISWFIRIVFVFVMNCVHVVRSHSSVFTAPKTSTIKSVWKSVSNLRNVRSPLNIRGRFYKLIYGSATARSRLVSEKSSFLKQLPFSSFSNRNEIDFPSFVKSVEDYLSLQNTNVLNTYQLIGENYNFYVDSLDIPTVSEDYEFNVIFKLFNLFLNIVF